MNDDLASLHRQLAEAEANFRLIQERKAEYVQATDIPLQLIRDERVLLGRIGDLRGRIQELEASRLVSPRPDATPRLPYRTEAPATAQERTNRTRMLVNVHDFWVQGVLEKSLYAEVLLDLGTECKPDAVAYPWDTIVQRPDAAPEPLPPAHPLPRSLRRCAANS